MFEDGTPKSRLSDEVSIGCTNRQSINWVGVLWQMNNLGNKPSILLICMVDAESEYTGDNVQRNRVLYLEASQVGTVLYGENYM